MKNLFKKLALVLALALVVTTIAPVATASASTKTPGLVNSGKILYIGGDYEGKYTDTYTFKFQNTYGLTATWKANNPDIAKMSGKKNTVVAVAPGTATFTVTLKNKAGKVVKTTTATVWVRQNADGVGFGSLKKAETPMNIGDSFRIYAYRQLGTTKVWTTEDFSLITDKIVWSSSDKNVATVDAKWGTVKAVGAGEAKITATVVQSNGVRTDLSASYTVSVGNSIVSAKPLSSDSAELTFATKVTQEVVNTLTLMTSTGSNITNYIKKVTLDATGTKATVELYVPFVNKETYTFAIKGLDTKIEMPVVIGDAAKIEIVGPTTAVVGTATEIEFNVLDSNNVVIATSKDTSVKSKVEYTLSDYTFASESNGNITMYKEGATTVVTAEYKTGTYDSNWNEIVYKASTVVTCVKAADVTIVGDITAVVTDKTTLTDADYNGNMTIALNPSKSYFLKVKGTDSKKNTVTEGFTFETLDATKLFVNSASGQLLPIAAGTVSVRVSKDNFVTIVRVTVVPEAKADKVEVSVSGSNVLSNEVNETVDFKLTVKDQYGNKMPAEKVTVECMEAPEGVDKSTAASYMTNDTNGTVRFDSLKRTEGKYTYKLTTQEKSVYVSVTVKAPDKTIASYKFLLSKNTIDTTIKADTDLDTLKSLITVVGVDANGLAVSVETGAEVVIKDANDKTVATTTKDGKVEFNALTAVSGGAISVSGSGVSYDKLAAGSYKVTGTVNNRVIAPSTIVVTDTQKAPVIGTENAVINLEENSAFDLAGKLKGLLTLPTDAKNLSILPLVEGTNFDTTFVSTTNVGTTHAVVKSVNVVETLKDGLTITHNVKLNKVFTIIVK